MYCTLGSTSGVTLPPTGMLFITAETAAPAAVALTASSSPSWPPPPPPALAAAAAAAAASSSLAAGGGGGGVRRQGARREIDPKASLMAEICAANEAHLAQLFNQGLD